MAEITEATARWRAEDPEARGLTMPDLGELLRWLMDDADRARAGVRHIGRCGSEREPDGSECMEQLYAAPGAVQVECPKCKGWQGVNAPGRPPGFLMHHNVAAPGEPHMCACGRANCLLR